MDEIEQIEDKPQDPDDAVVINRATFAWEKESAQESSHQDSLLNGEGYLVNQLFDVDLTVKKVRC